jgi:hypothetical protein
VERNGVLVETVVKKPSIVASSPAFAKPTEQLDPDLAHGPEAS